MATDVASDRPGFSIDTEEQRRKRVSRIWISDGVSGLGFPGHTL